MPLRTTIFSNDEYYHVFNRGVAKQPIFSNKRDYERFLLNLSYHQYEKLPFRLSRLLQLSTETRNDVIRELEYKNEKCIELAAYVLMPNHFHLLLKQTANQGVSRFVSTTLNGYTKYYNTKNERVGHVFQGMFKAVRVESDEQLVHVSRYLHLNPIVSYLIKKEDLTSYQWSSLPIYLGSQSNLVNPEAVLSHFTSTNDYLKFVLDQLDYGRELKRIEHLTLDLDR